MGIPVREAGKYIVKDHKVDLEHQRLDDPVKTVINKLREKIRQLEEEVDALIHRERENVL